MLTGMVYSLGRIVNCNGAGAGVAQLTGSYTASTPIVLGGMGNLSLSGLATFGGGATSVTIKLVDYSDPSNPRDLASVVPGGSAAVEHTFGSAGPFTLEANLGGVRSTVAVMKKAAGVLAAGDVLTIDATGSEKF